MHNHAYELLLRFDGFVSKFGRLRFLLKLLENTLTTSILAEHILKFQKLKRRKKNILSEMNETDRQPMFLVATYTNTQTP